ncbi:MAG: DUF1080 domain-containing protein [Saprospiraceae bacterium]|nr:DUF1080 domain-containing protein [Saprospiraceae bacterium]
MKIINHKTVILSVTVLILLINISCRNTLPKPKDLPASENMLPSVDDGYPFDKFTPFTPLFNRHNLGSWTMQDSGFWSVENEAIIGRPYPSSAKDSWLLSNDEYDDFALKLEFMLPQSGNSGVAIRMPRDSFGDPDRYGYEVQICNLPKRKLTGSLLHHAESFGNNKYNPDLWNQMTIICKGDSIIVYLNHEQILNERVNGSKKGRVGFQIPKDAQFSSQVAKFRNIYLQKLSSRLSNIPPDYTGLPFKDSVYTLGPQVIPGKIECAYFDLGGEGVAYHDLEPKNLGSGGLNVNPRHQRPQATPYEWGFRMQEGVDLSYTKDFADFNHLDNYYTPALNQFYVGWTEDNEWLNYSIDVKKAGTYNIRALYSNYNNIISFDIDHKKASTCTLPVNTGSYHIWNNASVGSITFDQTGLHLLTFNHNAKNNFAYFEFIFEEEKSTSGRSAGKSPNSP